MFAREHWILATTCTCKTLTSFLIFDRAVGILLVKMFADPSFTGLRGTGQLHWRDFFDALNHRLDTLRGSLGVGDVGEETHHVSLACELIEACLQQQPEDRCEHIEISGMLMYQS